MEDWSDARLNAEVEFAVSEMGQLRREEREIEFAKAIVRLRAELATARRDAFLKASQEVYRIALRYFDERKDEQAGVAKECTDAIRALAVKEG